SPRGEPDAARASRAPARAAGGAVCRAVCGTRLGAGVRQEQGAVRAARVVRARDATPPPALLRGGGEPRARARRVRRERVRRVRRPLPAAQASSSAVPALLRAPPVPAD